ncbi:hypothetical protein P879_01453 [Paragonimus westermani]|uniref:Uncharacterized protein n=1 Tax=Paragonimus westermani TaxID=34504 RepID=A0A8T0DBK5_9TREM|nr:hypothetical protein P879_01453 [Paragonimus westermani]
MCSNNTHCCGTSYNRTGYSNTNACSPCCSGSSHGCCPRTECCTRVIHCQKKVCCVPVKCCVTKCRYYNCCC